MKRKCKSCRASAAADANPRTDTASSRPPPFPTEAYNAALAQEREARELAFLDVNHEICGVEIRPLTLRMFIELCYAQSPFLIGGPIGPEHIAQILWRLTPFYEPPTSRRLSFRAKSRNLSNHSGRAKFIKSIALTVPYAQSRKEIEEYLDLVFFDVPPSGTKNKAPTVAFATSMIDLFAREYGWTRETILDSPLNQLFQLLKEITRRINPDAVSMNRLSDKVKSQWGRDLEDHAKRTSTTKDTKSAKSSGVIESQSQNPSCPS